MFSGSSKNLISASAASTFPTLTFRISFNSFICCSASFTKSEGSSVPIFISNVSASFFNSFIWIVNCLSSSFNFFASASDFSSKSIVPFVCSLSKRPNSLSISFNSSFSLSLYSFNTSGLNFASFIFVSISSIIESSSLTELEKLASLSLASSKERSKLWLKAVFIASNCSGVIFMFICTSLSSAMLFVNSLKDCLNLSSPAILDMFICICVSSFWYLFMAASSCFRSDSAFLRVPGVEFLITFFKSTSWLFSSFI